MRRKKQRRNWDNQDYFWQRAKERLIAGVVVGAVALVVWGVRELIERL